MPTFVRSSSCQKMFKTFLSPVLFIDAEFVTNRSFSFPCTAFLLWVVVGSEKRETKNACCLGGSFGLVWFGLGWIGFAGNRFLGRHESHSQKSILTKPQGKKKIESQEVCSEPIITRTVLPHLGRGPFI